MARDIKNDIKGVGVKNTPTPTLQPQAEKEVKPTPAAPIISQEQATQERDRMKQEADAMNAEKGAKQASLDYGQMSKILEDETKKSRDAMTEEKIRKRKQLFNAIGDGLSALTNLYFTTQGAPNVEYDPRGSLTARQQERWDAIDANRNALAQQEYQRKQTELAQRIAQRQAENQAAREARRRVEDRMWQREQAETADRRHQETLANRRAIAEINATQRRETAEMTQKNLNYRANAKASGGGQKGKPILAASGETIYVPDKYLDDKDVIAEMYIALPEHLKVQAFEDYNLGKYDAKRQLTNAQMNDIVSQYRSHPDAIGVEKVLRRLAGMKPTADSDNVPPSRRAANNDNVPPSRR